MSGNRFMPKVNVLWKRQVNIYFQGINPGGVYQAIWCRDASYIFQTGSCLATLTVLSANFPNLVTSNNTEQGKNSIGRGWPDTKFLAEVAEAQKEKTFTGAFPTTIYQAGFSEVYGQNPDIDSTALMISTTSWILATSLSREQTIAVSPDDPSEATVASVIHQVIFHPPFQNRNNTAKKSC